MAQLICSSCNYKFSSFRMPLNCPYCGKKGTVNREESVDDILKEVDKMVADGRC